MLPLAISAALLMLLSSFSFQALALQQRAQLQLLFHQRQLEDQLHSAAQRLVGRLQRQHACLLALPLEQWPAATCGPEAGGLHPAVVLAPSGIQLLGYQPGVEGAQLLLRREAGGAAAAFLLHWQPAAGSVQAPVHGLQFLGLRGVAR